MAETMKISPALKKRAAQIKVFLMDVDGTMTDGGVTLLSQPDGTALEIKTFDAHDGQGLTLAHTAGIRTGCITGRESASLLRRAGLAVAVGDAVPEVKEAAHYTTKALAGRGAVREAIELILKSKGIWKEMIDKARA
jgi:3-deoxy-D-manno-octulosonate 8-phosphate phosphatase (KDO 8-P phosphatase)